MSPPASPSFRLAPSRLTGRDLVVAGDEYRAHLRRLPAELRDRFEGEQRALADDAGSWIERYNRNLFSRVSGYWALGRRLDFDYPWPVVAILGICQVLGGVWRSRFYGLLGACASQLRYPRLEKLADATDDILRRTNRGIFADSVPTVLYALRCRELRDLGDHRLAAALEDGPLPPILDDESRELIRRLVRYLEEPDPARRFRDLSKLTMRHFDREQAVFSHHMGVERDARYQPRRGWLGLMTRPRSVPAPVIVGSGASRKLHFAPFSLPADFDMRNHDSRVAAFGAAFVQSVTGSPADYRVALDYLWQRFAANEERPRTSYDSLAR